MKSVRLLPIVVLAGFALLLFKSIGLLTNGGYVLVGGSEAVAEEHGAPAATEEGGDPTITLPSEPTLMDDAPTLTDDAPTLSEAVEAGHGAPAGEAEHGDTAAAEGDHGEAGVDPAAEGAHDLASACDPVPADGTSALEHGVDTGGAATEALGEDCPLPADAVPTTIDGSGNTVPLVAEDGSSLTEKQILERLAERRTQLDAFEAELAIRASLVEAAEKRIEERVAALEAVEARINALVEEKKAIDEGEFKGLVSLYEAMKPGDAAQIFDELDMLVLLKVARSMNPKKLAPVMAKMDPSVAQTLTVNLAVNEPEPTMQIAGEDLSALPQIVGQ